MAYEGVGREIVARLKYRNARCVVPWLAAEMASLVGGPAIDVAIDVPIDVPIDVVVPVPTTAARRRERGFDQGHVLAVAVARRLGLPCRPLLRRRSGPSQTGRPRLGRLEGPEFDVRGGRPVPAHVLLVDDVVTTGATLTAAARALADAGARQVRVVVAARTAWRSGSQGSPTPRALAPDGRTLPGLDAGEGVALEITITGRKVEISRSVRSAVEEKVGRLGRFLEGMERADVVFTEERNPRISEKEVCEVTLHGHGHFVRASAAAPDALAAVDLVVDKLTHRLRKLKGKLVSRSHPRRHEAVDPSPAGPLGIPDQLSDVPDEDSEVVEDLRIVRAKRFDIKPMTPPEAVLQMELLGHDFFLFTNAETSAAAVVYRRKDGDVGLIEGS